jgi:hypothetical protein
MFQHLIETQVNTMRMINTHTNKAIRSVTIDQQTNTQNRFRIERAWLL